VKNPKAENPETAFSGRNDVKNQGTVRGTSWSGVTIDWDDGDSTSVSHNDMAQITRVASSATAQIGQEAQPAALCGSCCKAEAVGDGFLIDTGYDPFNRGPAPRAYLGGAVADLTSAAAFSCRVTSPKIGCL
jgi:hypothetical protein